MKKESNGLLTSDALAGSFVNSAVEMGNSVIDPVVCICGASSEGSEADGKSKTSAKRLKKTAALYATMVVVSTCAIFLLEHATVFNAFRTALVAAVGKTIAASWVTSFFD